MKEELRQAWDAGRRNMTEVVAPDFDEWVETRSRTSEEEPILQYKSLKIPLYPSNMCIIVSSDYDRVHEFLRVNGASQGFELGHLHCSTVKNATIDVGDVTLGCNYLIMNPKSKVEFDKMTDDDRVAIHEVMEQ